MEDDEDMANHILLNCMEIVISYTTYLCSIYVRSLLNVQSKFCLLCMGHDMICK